jgi:hypothetical protein
VKIRRQVPEVEKMHTDTGAAELCGAPRKPGGVWVELDGVRRYSRPAAAPQQRNYPAAGAEIALPAPGAEIGQRKIREQHRVLAEGDAAGNYRANSPAERDQFFAAVREHRPQNKVKNKKEACDKQASMNAEFTL